jgi:uncharacterized protein YbcI
VVALSREETEDRPAMSSGPIERPRGGQLASAISNRVVRVISEYTGRGPTSARTYLNDDLVSVVVRDTLTKGERSLVADGKAQVVLGMRREFQQTMGRDLVAAVEELTGREVIAFFSANHIEPDTAVESFLLAPHGDGDGSLEAAEATVES